MGSMAGARFAAPPEVVTAHGLLFDFDGTIIDSTSAIVKHWHKQGNLIGVDPEVILATSHGRRSIDVFKTLAPEKANWEYICHEEGLIPIEFGNDAEEIPGARKLLTRLDAVNAPWAVVTSGTRPLVDGWLQVLQLTNPNTMVTAEDVEDGKPNPSCYLLGRKRLHLEDHTDLLVLEDAPSGIRAGKAAGFKVIGLTTTHTITQVKEAGADWIVEDLRSISINGVEDGIVRVEITDALLSEATT